MLRPERFSSSPKFSKKKTLKGTSDYWAASCPVACLESLKFWKENRITELAFARSRGKQRPAAEMLTVVTVHPRGRLTQQASGD
jgi:hypothetical protein